MAVTAAQAIANHSANPAIAAQAIADTAANLLAAMTDLVALQTAGGIAGVQLIGTGNVVSAPDAKTLSQLHNFTLASGATLIVADGPTALLDGANAAGLLLASAIRVTGTNTVTVTVVARLAAIRTIALASGATLATSGPATTLLANAAGLALASTVQLTGTANTVSAANAAILAHLPGFALATGATLTISDTSVHLLDPANAAAYPFATRVILAGGGTVGAADATALVALHNFRAAGGTTLQVADGAANLLLTANAAGLAKAVTVSLNADATVSALDMRTLARLHKFAIGSGVTLTVADSADQLLLPSVAAGLARATSVLITGANVENVARTARLGKIAHLALAPGATLVLRDNAPHLVSADGLAAITLATSVEMTGANSVSAAQADMFAALAHFSLASGATFLVSDSAAQLLSAANATGLALATKVRLTGSNTVSAADALRLATLPDFHLGVAVPGTLTVSDSAAAVTTALDALRTMAAAGQITTIALTDTGSPAITLGAARYDADAAALALISTPIALTVVAAPGDTVAARSAGITLDGSAGTADLSAVATGGDTLIGGADDTLNGGAGSDVFVFGTTWGSETVTGFVASDVLQFSAASFADWAHLLGASAQVGSDVVITLDAGDTITLTNVTLSSLTSGNARFV